MSKTTARRVMQRSAMVHIAKPAALLAGVAAMFASACSSAAAPAKAQPNIVYILADDLGWKDVGFNGSDISTPNIDSLAKSGAVFKQLYAQPLCTPTRAALMTGRYPFRYGLQTGVIPSGGGYGLATDEVLLPQALKAAGYDTALVGKWHLGHANKAFWPKQRGFDYFYGPLVGEIDHFKHTAHGVVDWYRGNDRVVEAGYDTDLLGADAARLVAAHDPNKPLFLYLSFTAPHTPYQAPQKYIDRYGKITDPSRRIYAAMITDMDDEIGRVVAALRKRRMQDNTLIIFQSDNGGTRSAMFAGESAVKGELPPNNGPYRDGKGSVYEGGTRVAGLVNWPGHVATGSVDGMVHVVDMYPTLTGLAGAAPRTKPLDGVDVWPALSRNAPSPRHEVVYNVEPFRAAVRQDDWKLVSMVLLPGKTELFNLAKDPYENTNLATANPAEVAKLQSRITELSMQAMQPLLLGEMIRLTYGAPLSTPQPGNFADAIDAASDDAGH